MEASLVPGTTQSLWPCGAGWSEVVSITPSGQEHLPFIDH